MGITIWHRVECDTVFDDPSRGLESGLAAAIYDPLWLLARQLQLGELHGEDAGSVVSSRVKVSSYAVRAPRPLEAHVEMAPQPADLRLRIRGGLLLLDLLADHQLDAAVARARTAFPFTDASTNELFAIASAPDGARVLAAIDAHSLSGTLSVQQAALQPVIDQWLAWYGARIGRGAIDTWVGDVLEHRSTVSADAGIELGAPAYRGPDLDWDAFDLHKPPQRAATLADIEVVPLPLDVPGLPVSRFWELEDPRFDASDMTAGPGEVGRVLLSEIAVCYAGDWMIAPCRVPTGALAQVDEVEVTDVFGVRSLIPAATSLRTESAWSLWSLSASAPGLRFIGERVDTLDGEPVEEVTLVRDELANLVWAHERVVPSPLGIGESVTDPTPPASTASSSADLVYLPLPTLPAGRIPLARTDDPAILAIAKTVTESLPPPIRGTLLSSAFRMRDGELGDDGLVVTRRFRAQRRQDGTLISWVARARHAGAAQPAALVEFDAVRISSS